ncbi:hypothetical protein D1872_243840 [compost metagenome]
MPYCWLRRRSSYRVVASNRAPLAPSGCPRAIAPPFTFVFSIGNPSSRIQANACEAKASFNSNTSMWSIDIFISFNSLRIATTGPIPITSGATPPQAKWTIRPSGFIPYSFTFSSLISSTAAAPSLMPDEFPAVTEPFLRKAGFSFPNASIVTSRRGCSSCINTTGSRFGPGTVIGTISSANIQSSIARIALR